MFRSRKSSQIHTTAFLRVSFGQAHLYRPRILPAQDAADFRSKRLSRGVVPFRGLHHATVPPVPAEGNGFAGAVGPLSAADLQAVGPTVPKTALDGHIDGISVGVRPADIALKFRPYRPEDAGLHLPSEDPDLLPGHPEYGYQKTDDPPGRDEDIPYGGHRWKEDGRKAGGHC